MTYEELSKIRDGILNTYLKEDVSLCDILATTKVPKGMTFEEAYRTYIRLMRAIEKDEFIRCNFDEEWIEYIYDGKFYNGKNYDINSISETDKDNLVNMLNKIVYHYDDED